MSDSFDPRRYRLGIQAVFEDGEIWLRGTVSELPDVAVFGRSYDEVAADLHDVIARLHAIALEHGKAFPPPASVTDEFSGRITLRVPKSMHAQMVACAAADDASLNTWIVSVMGERVGKRSYGMHEIAEVVRASSEAVRLVTLAVEGAFETSQEQDAGQLVSALKFQRSAYTQ